MKTIVATALCSMLATALGAVGIIAVLSPQIEPHPVKIQDGYAPSHYQQQYQDSLRGFRDAKIWRDFYGVGQINNRQFCTGGDLRLASGRVYRSIPQRERFGPYQYALGEEYREEIPPPQDGDYFHVTLVYLDKTTDPASKHLANAFMQPGHWLDHLRKNSHFRTVTHGDDLYKSWIQPRWGLREQDLPAVVVTEPIDKKRPQANQQGRLVYFAPAHDAPWHPDRLAYEIWTQMKKGPYALYQDTGNPAQDNHPMFQEVSYEQCGPDGCRPDDDEDDWWPRRDRRRSWLPTVRPNIDLGLGRYLWWIIGGLFAAMLFGLLLIGVIIVIFIRSR